MFFVCVVIDGVYGIFKRYKTENNFNGVGGDDEKSIAMN